MSDLLNAIEAIVGSAGIIKATDVQDRIARWGSNDKMQADAIVRPASTAELSRVMVICHDYDQPVLPIGGNTGLTGVATAGAGEIFLSLERMTNIEEVNMLEGTIAVDAGATLQLVQEKAEAAGFIYPIDLGARGSCTIGGNIATNAGGNEVIRYGMTREQVLGIEVVLADGSIVNSMNTLLKNNTGYDLKQLFIGSEGSLGIITKAVLRLRPKPKSRNTAFLAADSFDDVMYLLTEVKLQLGSTLSSFEVMWQSFYDFMVTDPNMKPPKMDAPHPYYILLEVAGTDPERDNARFIEVLGELFETNYLADAVIATNDGERAAMWALRDNVPHLISIWPFVTFDISVPLSRMEEYLNNIEASLNDAFGEHRLIIFGHLGDGNLHPIVTVPDYDLQKHAKINEIVYGHLEAVDGSISAEHGIGIDKKPYLKLSRSKIEIDIMRKIKEALDPKGLLAAGRIFD